MTTRYPLHAPLADAAAALPEQADVVIAWAGIVGCAAAYYLSRRGIQAMVRPRGML